MLTALKTEARERASVVVTPDEAERGGKTIPLDRASRRDKSTGLTGLRKLYHAITDIIPHYATFNQVRRVRLLARVALKQVHRVDRN
jgi:hypothetical protein